MDIGEIILDENEINAGDVNIPLIKGDKGDTGEKRRYRGTRHTWTRWIYSSKRHRLLYRSGKRRIKRRN